MQTTTNDRTSSNGTSGYQGTEQGQPVAGQERNRKTRASRKAAAPRKASGKSKASRKAAKYAQHWAHGVSAAAIALSSGLNGWQSMVDSHSQAPASMAASAAIGGIIPLLVWGLSKTTAWTHRAGWERLARWVAAVAGCLLTLSVFHVAKSLQGWTGMDSWLSYLFAVGIDCGIVAAEAVAVLVDEVDVQE